MDPLPYVYAALFLLAVIVPCFFYVQDRKDRALIHADLERKGNEVVRIKLDWTYFGRRSEYRKYLVSYVDSDGSSRKAYCLAGADGLFYQ